MLNENWELITTVTATYSTYSDFDLYNIIKEYNEEYNTEYNLEHISDIWIKRNEIHLEMNDWETISYEWITSDWDYKSPDDILYNQYTPEYLYNNTNL